MIGVCRLGLTSGVAGAEGGVKVGDGTARKGLAGKGLVCEGELSVDLALELGLRGTWAPLGLRQWSSGLSRPRMLVWV